MSSKESSIEIRTKKADAAALERAATDAASGPGDYLAFLARFPQTSTESLRKREGPRGEPFRLS